jgi:hypothetical protein
MKTQGILVSYATLLRLDRVDTTTVLFVILWIAPQIYLMTYGFNVFHRYFQANIIYFVTRGDRISKSYWLILKSILVELAVMVLCRVLLILLFKGQFNLLLDSKIILQILLFYLITVFLILTFINIYIVYQKDVLYPILVIAHTFLIFLYIHFKVSMIEVFFIRGSIRTLFVSIFALLIAQIIQLVILHQCIKQVEYK